MVELCAGNLADHLCNGALGIFRGVRKNQNGEITHVWIEFADKRSGKALRVKAAHQQMYPHKNMRSWTPITRITKEIHLYGNVKFKLVRSQFRILPAAARTLYRAQGQSIHEYGIDVTREGKRPIQAGAAYTAESRGTDPSNIYRRFPLVHRDFVVDQSVVTEVQHL